MFRIPGLAAYYLDYRLLSISRNCFFFSYSISAGVGGTNFTFFFYFGPLRMMLAALSSSAVTFNLVVSHDFTVFFMVWLFPRGIYDLKDLLEGRLPATP